MNEPEPQLELDKSLMRHLDIDLRALIHENLAPKNVLDRRRTIQGTVQRALRSQLGEDIVVRSFGMDYFTDPLIQAPHELLVNFSDLSNPVDNRLSQFGARNIVWVLKEAGIPVEMKTPQRFNPITDEDLVISNREMKYTVIPPGTIHAKRAAFVASQFESHPIMRDLLSLMHLCFYTGTLASLPPLTSIVFAYLTISFFNTRRNESSKSSVSSNPSTHLTASIHPGGSVTSNIVHESIPVIKSLSEGPQYMSLAHEFLQLLRWWDSLRWDQHVILAASSEPKARDLDGSETTDTPYNPLFIQDPLDNCRNISSWIQRTEYAGLFHSARALYRQLQSGTPLFAALKRNRMLRPDNPSDFYAIRYPLPSRVLSAESQMVLGDELTEDMQTLFQNTRPPAYVQASRILTLQRIQDIVKSRFGSNYVPVIFGSSRYGVDEASSDLDIVIMDYTRPYGFDPSVSLTKIYNLHVMANYLRENNFGKMVVIANAKVPIIKAKDLLTGHSVDININDRLGAYNTELLQHYSKLWPPLGNLIYIIKRWAKGHHLNDPSGQNGAISFSSYCLTLMIVGFLQTFKILPNLQDSDALNNPKKPTYTAHCQEYFWIRTGKETRLKCNTIWNKMPVNDWSPAANPSLGRVLFAWFMFFGYDFSYEVCAIRVAEGGMVPRRTRQKRARRPKKRKLQSNEDTKVNEEVESTISSTTLVSETAVSKEQSESEDDNEEQEEEEEDNIVQVETKDVPAERVDDIEAEARAIIQSDKNLEATVEAEKLGKGGIDEPWAWKPHGFVVGDPFIEEKNCAANVGKPVLQKFIEECRIAAKFIEDGAPLDTILLSTGAPIQKPRPQRKRNPKKAKGNPQNVQTAQPNTIKKDKVISTNQEPLPPPPLSPIGKPTHRRRNSSQTLELRINPPEANRPIPAGQGSGRRLVNRGGPFRGAMASLGESGNLPSSGSFEIIERGTNIYRTDLAPR